MAGLIVHASAAETALVAATAKTLLQVVTIANHRFKVLSWGVSFDGVSGTAEPVVVELCQQTTAGTSSAATYTKNNANDTETPLGSALGTFSAEPGASTVVARVEVHPQGGFQETFPFGQEIVVGGSAVTRLGIRCTAPANVNAIAYMRVEE